MKAHALAVAVAITVGLAACAGDGSPEGPNGEPTEALTVVTTSGEHDFWVEIADDDRERARKGGAAPRWGNGWSATWPGGTARDMNCCSWTTTPIPPC